MYYKFRITRKTISDNELEKNVVRKDMNVYDHERLQWRNLTRVCSSRESLSLSPPSLLNLRSNKDTTYCTVTSS
jgi:hypothetical protein